MPAAAADHPGHRRRAADWAKCRDAGFGHRIFRQLQQPVTEGGLQRCSQEWHQRRRQQVVLAVEQGQGPGLALAVLRLAQALQGLLHRRVSACIGEFEQRIQQRQPGAVAHQGLVGERRHAVLHAALQRRGVRQRQGCGTFEHLLLGIAEAGDQLQVVAQWMAVGELAQAGGAAGEQVGRRQVEEWRDVRCGLDLAGFENGAWHAGLLSPRRAVLIVEGRCFLWRVSPALH
ncbi:hypothetical protein D3C81_1544650 [compost metagenome]